MIKTIEKLKALQDTNLVKYVIYSFDDLKINYWGITKCANTSVRKALQQKQKTFRNITPKQAIESDYYNFTVIREPVERFISMYKWNLTNPDLCYLAEPLDIDSLLEMIQKQNDADRNVHFRTQSYFIEHQNKVIPALYGVHQLSEIEQKLGIQIPRLNQSRLTTEKPVSLSEKQLNTIEQIYKTDFNIWKML